MSHLTGQRAVATAALVARLAHAGQTDKAGQAYVDHPRRVAERVTGDLARTVAWLHDVVEDTPVTLDELEQAFGPRVADAVDALTVRHGETRAGYYARVRANPTALTVKLADIADNTDPDRLTALPADLADRLRAKYAAALAALT